MKRIAAGFFLLAFLATIVLLLIGTGCAHTDIIVPYDAPLMLSGDETIHNPYVRERGGWVLKSGTVTRHAGAHVEYYPATQAVK